MNTSAKINQTTIGFILATALIAGAFLFIAKISLALRFIIGLSFGFVLVKSSLGFAGSVNRLSRMGTSATAKALMYMFIITAIFTAFIIYGNENSYALNIYPINIGLLAGGLLFGFGMALSSCCATGSLTDLASGFSRASVTIFFFMIGVFLGFRYQGTASWVKESWISSEHGDMSKGGVFLPDLFTFDGFNGYLGALVLTIILAFIIIYLAQKYEEKLNIKKPEDVKKEKTDISFTSIIMNPWNLKISVIVIAFLFSTLLFLSGKGWSATSPFGVWFAKLLMLFGMSAQDISAFTTRPIEFFTQPLLEYSTSLQNFGIIFGAVIALLFARTFDKKFISGLVITPLAFVVYAFGGFIMGFGTRLSNGCNVGALYTPIAEFSLSGWLYLIVVAIGGFSGNWFIKRYISKTCVF